MFDYINSTVKCKSEKELLYMIGEYEKNTDAKWYARTKNDDKIRIDFSINNFPYCYYRKNTGTPKSDISCITFNKNNWSEYDYLKEYSYEEYIIITTPAILTPYDFI